MATKKNSKSGCMKINNETLRRIITDASLRAVNICVTARVSDQLADMSKDECVGALIIMGHDRNVAEDLAANINGCVCRWSLDELKPTPKGWDTIEPTNECMEPLEWPTDSPVAEIISE